MVVCGPINGQLGAFGLLAHCLLAYMRMPQTRQPTLEEAINHITPLTIQRPGRIQANFNKDGRKYTTKGKLKTDSRMHNRLKMCNSAVNRNNVGR